MLDVGCRIQAKTEFVSPVSHVPRAVSSLGERHRPLFPFGVGVPGTHGVRSVLGSTRGNRAQGSFSVLEIPEGSRRRLCPSVPLGRDSSQATHPLNGLGTSGSRQSPPPRPGESAVLTQTWAGGSPEWVRVPCLGKRCLPALFWRAQSPTSVEKFKYVFADLGPGPLWLIPAVRGRV